jgi:catechol 2,3-dioxygenase-like lactoylglutathione lyase family enzyme
MGAPPRHPSDAVVQERGGAEMIDHIVVRVRDLARSRRFYLEALAPLGYGIIKEVEPFIGFGVGTTRDFWIGRGEPLTSGVHVAFACDSRSEVDAFHASAIRAGGRDNGAPGVRAQYHPSYYGAFVLDPDGNNIEAVCYASQG